MEFGQVGAAGAVECFRQSDVSKLQLYLLGSLASNPVKVKSKLPCKCNNKAFHDMVPITLTYAVVFLFLFVFFLLVSLMHHI